MNYGWIQGQNVTKKLIKIQGPGQEQHGDQAFVHIGPLPNFMALLTISKEWTLAEAGNSAYFMGQRGVFLFCACVLHVPRHSTLTQLAQKFKRGNVYQNEHLQNLFFYFFFFFRQYPMKNKHIIPQGQLSAYFNRPFHDKIN